jgi:DNA-binding Lrp family transcriptional regulator
MNINEYEEALKEEEDKQEVYRSFLEDDNNYRIIHDKVTAIASDFKMGLIAIETVHYRLNRLAMDGLIYEFKFGYDFRSIEVRFLGNNTKRFCLW